MWRSRHLEGQHVLPEVVTVLEDDGGPLVALRGGPEGIAGKGVEEELEE